MANEAAVFSEGVGGLDSPVIVRTFTVADATAIPEGTLMVYDTASRTAIAHTAAAASKCRPLGFATSSKLASDGHTTIGLQRTGVVTAVADGVITTGDWVVAGRTTANRVQSIDVAAPLSLYQDLNSVLGRAITSAAAAGTVKVALALG